MIHDSPHEDDDYIEALEKATVDIEVNDNFQTEYQLSATYISPEFKDALNKRVQSIYDNPNTDLVNSDSKSGYFISVFAPDTQLMNLTDSNLWSIHLKSADKKYTPLKIKKIYKKEKWEAFFPYISAWSQEYFILFEKDQIDASLGKMVSNPPTELIFSNSKTKSILTWP
jgi:hypothetical protein